MSDDPPISFISHKYLDSHSFHINIFAITSSGFSVLKSLAKIITHCFSLFIYVSSVMRFSSQDPQK